MNCPKTARTKLYLSSGNEEALYKGHKLVKVILANAHDLNLEVEEEDQKLLEIHDRELTAER